MRRFHSTAILFLGLAALASAAVADNPFYFTGKLGNTSQSADFGRDFGQVVDGDDNSWGLGLGFRLGRYMAFQAELHDFGKVPGFGSPCPPGAEGCLALAVPVEADSSAVSVSFLPTLPLTQRLFVYGKLGFVSWESDVSEAIGAGGRFIDDHSSEDLLYGGGVRFKLPGPFAAFAEYERIADAFDTVALGATYGF